MASPDALSPVASAGEAEPPLEAAPPPETIVVEPVVEAPPVVARWSADVLRANVGWAALTSTALLLVFLILRFLPSVGWPLVLAGIFAYLFDPIAAGLVRRGFSRTAATAAIMGAGALVAVGAVLALLPLAISQARSFPDYLRDTWEKGVPRLEALTGYEMPVDLRALGALAMSHAQDLVTNVLPGAGSAVGLLVGGSLSVVSFLVAMAIVPVVGFFLLRGWPDVIAAGSDLVPLRHREVIHSRMGEVDRMLGGFIRGQLTLATILSALYAIALSLIGLKLGIVVGLVTGFGNLVPYVGAATGMVLAVGFCLVDFGVDHHLGLVALTFALLMAADGVFITPRVVGDRVGLSPAAVIVAVMTCGALFGFAGVLLAVPSAAILKLVSKVSVQAWKSSRFYEPV